MSVDDVLSNVVFTNLYQSQQDEITGARPSLSSGLVRVRTVRVANLGVEGGAI